MKSEPSSDSEIKDTTLSLRIPTELDHRLRKISKELGLSKNDVARHAIRAALDAIEARGYQIEWPLKMNASPKIPDYVAYELQRLTHNEQEGILKTLLRKARE